MHINLSSEMEKFLQFKVRTGLYNNASEVVREAIRRMLAEDEKFASLRAAIEVGDAELDKGEGREYTQDALERITKKARANARQGKKVNPDVTP